MSLANWTKFCKASPTLIPKQAMVEFGWVLRYEWFGLVIGSSSSPSNYYYLGHSWLYIRILIFLCVRLEAKWPLDVLICMPRCNLRLIVLKLSLIGSNIIYLSLISKSKYVFFYTFNHFKLMIQIWFETYTHHNPYSWSLSAPVWLVLSSSLPMFSEKIVVLEFIS